MSDRLRPPAHSAMRYKIRKSPGLTEIILEGGMSFSDHEDFQKMMLAFDLPAGDQVVLNLSTLQHVDSSGLGMLLIVGAEAQKKALKLRLVSPRAEVRRVIDLGRLDRVFDIQP